MSLESEQKKKLIINYLPQCLTDSELTQLFSTVGPLQECKIMRDTHSGYSFGYGFATYLNSAHAENAIDKFNGWEMYGKRLKVSFSRPPGQQIKNTNLYIQNLPKNYSESDVLELFSQYGKIVQTNLLTDKITGMPKGVAFVRYDKKQDADAATAALNGQQLDGSLLPLQIKIAEDHGKQKAAYFAGLQSGLNLRGGGPINPHFMNPTSYPRPQVERFQGNTVKAAREAMQQGRERFNPLARGQRFRFYSNSNF